MIDPRDLMFIGEMFNSYRFIKWRSEKPCVPVQRVLGPAAHGNVCCWREVASFIGD